MTDPRAQDSRSKTRPPSTARRLIAPLVAFLLFVGLAFFRSDLTAQFGQEALGQTRIVLSYIFQIGAWLASAWLVSRLLNYFFWEMLVERATGRPVPRLVKDIVATVIFLIAVTGIASFVFQRSVTGIWAASGALGIVVGFALRSMILDVFSGIALNVDNAYRIGDWIMIHQRTPEVHIVGCIMEINWRTTRLRTTHNNLVVVPNSVMGQAIVTNYMAPTPVSRLELYFTLDFSVPTERALRVLEGAVRAVCRPRGVLEDPRPKARVTRVNDLGIEYRIRYWVVPADLSPNKSRHIVVSSVLEHLQHAGLTLAYPKRDVFHTEMPQRHLDSASVADMTRLLGRTELYRDLEDDDLSRLAEGLVRREFRKGEALIKAGEEGDSMFVLVEGLVYVQADLKGEGHEVRVAQIVPGQFFGEMSLLTGERRSATITAATEAVAYELTKDAMTDIFRARPALAESISRVVAERKLRNQEAELAISEEDLEDKKRSLSGEILGRIRSFFRGVF